MIEPFLGNAIPGVTADRTYTPREVLWTQLGALYLPNGVPLKASLSRDPTNTGDIVTLRPGMLLGKTTTGGMYRPTIVGKSNLAYTSGDTTIQTDLATATEVARIKTALGGGNLSMKLIGPPTAAGTVAATAVAVSAVTLNGATSLLTCTNLALNKVTDSVLTLAEGSETPLGILNEFIRVTDIDGNDIDRQVKNFLVAGMIDQAQIINWPADTSTRTYLLGLLNAPSTGCGPFIAKGNFGF